MFKVPNLVSNVTDNIFGANKGKKIKGKVVLMRKSVLNFSNLASSAVDNFAEFLGRGVSFQLVSTINTDPANGFGRVGKVAYLESWITTIPSLTAAGKNEFAVYFDRDDEIGVPGAILVRNKHLNEFFLVSVTLEGIPNHPDIHFVCNSWVYPASKYKSDRIFFANKTYLPHETPEPLRKYREQELINLRGDGVGERKEWERIYDYATYNDLGWEDFRAKYARPTLGGSTQYPYPRRGRTGRPSSRSDSSKESRPLIPVNVPCVSPDFYVPRDENFGHLKQSDFVTYLIKSISQDLRPALELAFKCMSNEFDSFENVRQLYESRLHLPTNVLKQISARISLPMLKEIFRTDGERFLKFPTPRVIKDDKSAWMTDEEFARQMLAGVNPVVIRLLKEFPPKSKLDSSIYGDHTSKITEEQLEINLDGLKVDEALKNKRLFILDHHDTFILYLRKINQLKRKKAYATRTILFLDINDGTLRPVAIELSLPHPNGDQFGAVSKVYLPAKHGVQSTIWLLAKAYVAVNDTVHHQLLSHWLNTHAVVEPFVIATNRHLSLLHPIHKLLLPHFRDTMNINAAARRYLINAGGVIEKSFLAGKYAMEMSSEVYKNWVFPDQALPADLIKRGMAVEDPSSPHGLHLVIEDYPFAVDGLEIWFAMKTWVQEYVSFYYRSDEIVKKDTELQAWWKELVEVGHGDKRDESWWPKMQTLDELIETCTIVIWTSSALHAAVNFGQYPYGGYILNRPTLSRRLMPEEGSDEYHEMVKNPEKALLKTITPKFQTLIDLSLIEVLSRHTTDEYYLGDRSDNPRWTSDPQPLEAFERFGKKLAEIEEKLENRNRDKKLRNRFGPVNMPYTLLYPSSEEGLTGRGIPNSISI